MNAIVDLQGFKTDGNKFILKEIAILSNDQLQVFLIKPPFPFYDLTKTERKQVSWIERNRKIYWNEGYIPYSKHKMYIADILKSKHIITKGLEKVIWINEILSDDNNNNYCIYNLEDSGCPSIMTLYEKYESSIDMFRCSYHSFICAMKNVLCFKKWCEDNKLFY